MPDFVRDKRLPFGDVPIVETGKNLMYCLLRIDPSERIRIPDIRNHAWMKGYDTFKEYYERLTFGCIRGLEDDNEIPMISLVLKHLIVKFLSVQT